MTKWRLRIACCLRKTTNTHSDYVILTVFPPKECLHERASILRHTYIACHIVCTNSVPYLLESTSFFSLERPIGEQCVGSKGSVLCYHTLHVSTVCVETQGLLVFSLAVYSVFHRLKLQALRFLYIGQAFRYSPENSFYIFNQQIYFIISYLLDRASLI